MDFTRWVEKGRGSRIIKIIKTITGFRKRKTISEKLIGKNIHPTIKK